jgi:hypothetical protein
MLMSLEEGDTLAGATSYAAGVRITVIGRNGQARDEDLRTVALQPYANKRARKGRDWSGRLKVQAIQALA